MSCALDEARTGVSNMEGCTAMVYSSLDACWEDHSVKDGRIC